MLESFNVNTKISRGIKKDTHTESLSIVETEPELIQWGKKQGLSKKTASWMRPCRIVSGPALGVP